MKRALMTILLVCVALPALAQDAAKPAPTYVPNVPERPFDIVERFFDLAEGERDAIGAIEDRYDAERRAALEKIEAELDAKYAPDVLNTVHEDVRPIVRGVFASIEAYEESLKAADDDFRAAWKRATGAEPTTIPRSLLAVYLALPGMDPAKTAEMRRSLYRDIFAGVRDEVAKQAEAQGIKRPEGRDRNALRDYMTQTRGIQRAVQRAAEKKKLDELKADLTPEQATQLDALVVAYEARESKREMAMEMLAATLAELVDPEKLTDPGRGRRGGRGNFGAAGFGRGGRGNRGAIER